MKPIQYQRGYVEFYKLRFKVTPDVLIPRPETELLVDEVLNILRSEVAVATESRSSRLRSNNNHYFTILDLGAGSGAIAISIAKNLYPTPGVGVKIIASDISAKALKVAKQNAKLHGVSNKIDFIQSNLLENILPIIHNTYPLILVTNLPYIPTARIPYLDSSVKDFEPHIALDGGEDGFELYRKLFQQIVKNKCKPKLVIGEIDYTHGELAVLEAQRYFPNSEVEVKNDLAHKQRILIIKSKNS